MDQEYVFDPLVPSIARVYDYLLGGKDNYPADREIGEVFVQEFPGAVQIALDNRACLVRAVTVIAGELGIGQFIDLGSGLPAADNVHQVAQRADPQARVVYVDNDPVVLAHGRAELAGNPLTRVVAADIREPEQILADAGLRDLIDLERPVAVIASAVLHHLLEEENPLGVIRAFRAAVPPGSCVFVSHFRAGGDPRTAALEEVMLEAFGRGVWRTGRQIARYFDGTRLADPGIVPCARWRPAGPSGDLTAYQHMIVAGLGRI